MIIPNALVHEIASRRCIIFLGSGASAGCVSADGTKSPPTWSLFLQNLMVKMRTRTDDTLIEDYIRKEKYLEAAEIIIKNVPSGDFSTFIREELVIPRYKPSSIHESVLELDPKIVITTNYDDVYDNYCRTGDAEHGYNVSRYYEDHIISDLRSPVRLVVKAHGCVADSSKIVLTKSQYFRARQLHSNFYKILDALFLTHTLLFIGYSITDPDIQLVLENVNITAPSHHPHYIIIGDSLNETIRAVNKVAYNLEFIQYTEGDFNELNDGLKDLVNSVTQYRMDNPSV